MAKTSGLGDNLYVGGVDLSGNIGSISTIGGSQAVLDVTDITQSAMARLGGVRAGSLEFAAYFDPAVGASHPTLSALPTTDTVLTYARGTLLGNPAATMVAKQLNYDGTRAANGAFTFKVNAESNGYGLSWGTQVTAGKRADTVATIGAGVDFGASTAFGLQAYLQVFTLTGTSVTVKLQESNDDGAIDPYADTTGGGFVAATAVGAQRIATAAGQIVKRWLRVVTTGTFSAAVISVAVTKNDVATVF